jgi:Homeodomain-like domain
VWAPPRPSSWRRSTKLLRAHRRVPYPAGGFGGCSRRWGVCAEYLGRAGGAQACWHRARGHPSELVGLGSARSASDSFADLPARGPWHGDDLADRLDCSRSEAEAILWAYGYAPDSQGLWRRGGDEPADFLASRCRRKHRSELWKEFGRRRRSFSAMARAARHQIELSGEERGELERIARAEKRPWREVQRARIVLYAAGGLHDTEIAARLDTSAGLVGRWRRRFFEDRLEGLKD